MLQPILAKQATILGTLSGEQNYFAIPADNLSISFDESKAERQGLQKGMGTLGLMKSNKTAQISFTLPFRSKSDSVLPTHLNSLMQSCGLSLLSYVGWGGVDLFTTQHEFYHHTVDAGITKSSPYVFQISDFASISQVRVIKTWKDVSDTGYNYVQVIGGVSSSSNRLPKSKKISFVCSDTSCIFTVSSTPSYLDPAITIKSPVYDQIDPLVVLDPGAVCYKYYTVTASSLPAVGSLIYVNIFGEIMTHTVGSGVYGASQTGEDLFNELNDSIENTLDAVNALWDCTRMNFSGNGTEVSNQYIRLSFVEYRIEIGSPTGHGVDLPFCVSGTSAEGYTFWYPVDSGDVYDWMNILILPAVPFQPRCRVYGVNDSVTQDRMSFVLLYNGIYYQISDCVGTFSINSVAGLSPTITFNFSGFFDETDAVYEIPDYSEEMLQGNIPIAENGNIYFAEYGNEIIVENFSFSQENQVIKRTNINSSEGIDSFLVTKRNPKISIDPEVVPKWVFDPIEAQKNNELYPYFMKIYEGDSYNGSIWFFSPVTQIASVGFSERNGIKTTNLELISTEQGKTSHNSEFYFIFT